MPSHSLQELLNLLADGPATRGWGAVLAISRARMNRMLEQQFTAAFNSGRFLSPCSGPVGQGVLEDVVLGPPVLSFEIAEPGKAAGRITIPLLAGTWHASPPSKDRSPAGMRRTDLRMGSGVSLVMDIDVAQVLSDSDASGRISLDVAAARNPTCSLSEDPDLQKQIGAFLLAHIQKHPAHRTTYLLGVLDAGRYAPLNPVRFVVHTMAAPGARDPGARNAGDGAVLVFMKLQGLDDDDVQLPDAHFPYLIPNDETAGEPDYSATLLINRHLSRFVNDTYLDVLKASLLPKGYAFEEADGGRYTPHDTAIFGHLVATREQVVVSPAITEMEMGDTMVFRAQQGDGSAAPGVTWTTSCLNSPLMRGQMAGDGTFSASGYPFGGVPMLRTAVTAQYGSGEESGQASALALVHHRPFDLEPVVASTHPGGTGIDLVSSGDGGADAKEWTLLEPGLGELRGTEGDLKAVYTPPAAGGVPFVVQRLQSDAGSDRRRQSVVLLHTGVVAVEVHPAYVNARPGEGDVTFSLDDGSLDAALRQAGVRTDDEAFFRWSVVGEGQVSGSGRSARYTPPATRSNASLSVIVCEVLGPGVALYGYGVIELDRMSTRAPSTWRELNHFEITAPDGDICTANGMQQIRLRIFIETTAVRDEDGIDQLIPVSEEELRSLELVHGAARVPFINEHQEGIEYDDDRMWAASKNRNRFRLYNQTASRAVDAPTTRAENQTYVDLYLHLKARQSEEFHAQFQANDGRMFDSRRETEGSNGWVTLGTTPVPSMGREDYLFERERVWDGEGQDDGDDDMSYRLQSIDFWTLAFRESNFDTLGFATLQFEGNTSSVQWESELLDETFFSCTGFAFTPKPSVEGGPPSSLAFDPYLHALMDAVEHKQPDPSFHAHGHPSPGELIVSLHRESTVPYWYDGMAPGDPSKAFRKALDRALVVVLRDENGNRHRMQIGFLDPSQNGSRNHLRFILQ